MEDGQPGCQPSCKLHVCQKNVVPCERSLKLATKLHCLQCSLHLDFQLQYSKAATTAFHRPISTLENLRT